MFMFPLPAGVLTIMKRLGDAGHQVFVVGGSTRDALRGITPHDHDMTTSATPEEMKALFCDFRVIETGIKHGTLTILADGAPFEVTTYRVDGDYHDHRHPNEVVFTRSLEEDLARRDFTVNAIAYHPSVGLVDPFGGQADIAAKTLRAVGAPARRFEEDALRILRALRFAAVLDYTIEPQTAEAALEKRDLLLHVSAERVREELCRLLTGVAAAKVIDAYFPILTVRIPQLKTKHIRVLEAISRLPKDPVLRLVTLLLPDCIHAPAQMDDLMSDLRFDNISRRRAHVLLAQIHVPIIPQKSCVLRLLSDIDVVGFDDLAAVRAALAATSEEREAVLAAQTLAHDLLQSGACYRISDLAVNGADLITHTPLRGTAVGAALQTLLDAVIDGKTENDRNALLAYLQNP